MLSTVTATGVKDFHPKRHLSLPLTWWLLSYQNEGGKEEEGRVVRAKREADMLSNEEKHEEEHSDTE